MFCRFISRSNSVKRYITATTQPQKSPPYSAMATPANTFIVKLPQGDVKGIARKTPYDITYCSFEGIPYGKPPVGELRFKAPQPAAAWTGVRDCTQFDIQPVQKRLGDGTVEGQEDCLYLSVFAKTLQSECPLPVLVWIYGGAFERGSAMRSRYGPDYFMHENVVFVAFNYRLGALGFLNLCDETLGVPGNAGLKDQVLALKWIKQYISHFNGDCNNITVFGESAGGAAAHILMLTEHTRDLFQRGICMSGTALNYWVAQPQTDVAYRLAKQLGYEGENNDKQVLEHLCKQEASALAKPNLITPTERNNGVMFLFGPVVESYVGADCVIPEPLVNMLPNAWSNKIPMMLGGTTDEGLVKYPFLKAYPEIMTTVAKYPELLLIKELKEQLTTEEAKKLSEKLIELHFGDKPIDAAAILNFVDFYTHETFWHAIHRSALARLAYASADTYLYRFAFDSPTFNHHRLRFCGNEIKKGVAHADDLSYLFMVHESTKLEGNTPEYKTIERMIGLWTAFATNSDPNCAQIQPTVWKALEKDNPNMALNIDRDVEFIEMPERVKFDVWDSLYEKIKLY